MAQPIDRPQRHRPKAPPIESEQNATMAMLAQAIDQMLNGPSPDGRKMGFMLMLFPFGENPRCNFVTNHANHADLARMLRQQATDIEAHADTPARDPA